MNPLTVEQLVEGQRILKELLEQGVPHLEIFAKLKEIGIKPVVYN